MINIKSLTRINEADSSYDTRYKSDIDSAEKNYDKVLKDTNSWKYTPRAFSKDKVNKAYDEKENLKDNADARLKAAKSGMFSKQDYDDAKFEAAKAKHAIMMKTKNKVAETSKEADSPGIFSKIRNLASEHPYATSGVAAGTIAGIAAMIAMQKRKQRDPEPGSYQ